MSYSGKLTKSNGLRTAVKLGEITPMKAIDKLGKLEAKGKLVKQEIYDWLVRRHQKKGT